MARVLDHSENLGVLEGRLIAQRKALAALIAEVAGPDASGRLWRYLDERSVYQADEEDPGAVPSQEVALEFAVADEFRLIAESARRFQNEASAGG